MLRTAFCVVWHVVPALIRQLHQACGAAQSSQVSLPSTSNADADILRITDCCAEELKLHPVRLAAQGSFVTFEHNPNRVNIFFNPDNKLVATVPHRG